MKHFVLISRVWTAFSAVRGIAAAALLAGPVGGIAMTRAAGVEFERSPVVYVKWNSVDGQFYQFESQDLGGPWQVSPERLRGQGRESLLVAPADRKGELMRLRVLPGEVTNAVGHIDRLEFDGAQFTYDSNRMVVANLRASGVAVSTNDYVEMDFEQISGSAAFQLRATRIIPDVGVASGGYFVRGLTNPVVANSASGPLAERRIHTLNFNDGPVLVHLRTGQSFVSTFASYYNATLRLMSPSGRVIRETVYGSPGRKLAEPLTGVYEEGDYLLEIEQTGGGSGTYELAFRNANAHALVEVTRGSLIEAAFSGDELREYFKYRVHLDAGEVFRLPGELPANVTAGVLDDRSVEMDADASDGVTFVADRAGTYYLMLSRFNRDGPVVYRSQVAISRLRRR